MKRGSIRERADVNYAASSILVSKRYANPNYALTPLRRVIHKAQYGISLPATEEPIGLPMIRMNNLQNDGWDLTDLKYIELSEEEAKLYLVNSGNILFNRTNSKELVGKCEVFRESGDWVFASYLIRIVLDQSQAIPDFVSTFLNTKAGRIQIDRVSRQIIGMSNVNAEELQDLLIPIPPLEIQRSLVAEIQTARQTRKQKLAQADELFYSTDTYLLEQLGIRISIKPDIDNNQGFAVKRKKVGIRLDPFYNFPEHQVLESALSDCYYKVLAIGDERVVREIVEGRITPKPEFYSEFQEDPIFLRAQNIEKGYLNFSDAKRLTREAFEAETKAILLDDDIVLTIDGVLLGIAAVHRSGDQDCCISNHMVRIRHGIEIDPEYLVWFLNSSAGQRQIKRGITGSAIPGIRTDAIERILVPIPPMDIQRSLVVEIEKRRAEAQRLRQEAESEWETAKTCFEHKLLGEEA